MRRHRHDGERDRPGPRQRQPAPPVPRLATAIQANGIAHSSAAALSRSSRIRRPTVFIAD